MNLHWFGWRDGAERGGNGQRCLLNWMWNCENLVFKNRRFFLQTGYNFETRLFIPSTFKEVSAIIPKVTLKTNKFIPGSGGKEWAWWVALGSHVGISESRFFCALHLSRINSHHMQICKDCPPTKLYVNDIAHLWIVKNFRSISVLRLIHPPSPQKF